MRTPKLILVAGLLLSPLAAQAQTSSTVTGIVVDAETTLPLPNAHVTVSPVAEAAGLESVGISTNLDGAFALSTSLVTAVLTVSYVGFIAHVDTVQTAAARSLTIRLRPNALDLNQITVTASRKQQRKLDAPARVTVIGADQIARKGSVLTVADYLQEAPAVDVIRTGLNQSRVVVRGFNDNLSSNLLTLVDNRIARAPAVRLTALQLLPTISSDIDQMEVVSGPASALYGPNAANGVVHVLTKSPFASPGTSFSLTGGQHSVKAGAVRHAAILSSRWAYKVTGQYYSGRDFEYDSPAEQEARAAAMLAGGDPGRIGLRNYDVSNTALTARVEGRLGASGRTTLILDAGLTRGDNIETTPTGAAQVDGAGLGYAQVRVSQGRLFAQAYGNFLDSGDSFFLRTGESFIDKSRLYVAQVQHGLTVGRTDLTYGADWFRTVPKNEGTVSGGYEDSDTMNEPGVYVQSDTDLSAQWALTLAGRVDYHDRLQGAYFSPRAAVVYRPESQHNFRATWNRAFKSPASNQLFGDVLGARDLFGLGGHPGAGDDHGVHVSPRGRGRAAVYLAVCG
jgi:iron complex outermembrane receptor protein